jgi:predicted nucleic acid-binding protein
MPNLARPNCCFGSRGFRGTTSWEASRPVWAGRDRLAVSSVTYAELAAGARNRDGVDEDLEPFQRMELDFDAAWRAGQRFRQYLPTKGDSPVLPDFLIRGQAAALNLPHLTNDRRRLAVWPDVDFIFPEMRAGEKPASRKAV